MLILIHQIAQNHIPKPVIFSPNKLSDPTLNSSFLINLHIHQVGGIDDGIVSTCSYKVPQRSVKWSDMLPDKTVIQWSFIILS